MVQNAVSAEGQMPHPSPFFTAADWTVPVSTRSSRGHSVIRFDRGKGEWVILHLEIQGSAKRSANLAKQDPGRARQNN